MDIKKESRTGYSIGIGYPPDWGEQTLNISKGDKTILKPNITFHMIAVMQFGDWGVEASESVRVTEKGAETYSVILVENCILNKKNKFFLEINNFKKCFKLGFIMANSNSFVKFDKVDKSYDGEILVVKDLNLDIPQGRIS